MLKGQKDARPHGISWLIARCAASGHRRERIKLSPISLVLELQRRQMAQPLTVYLEMGVSVSDWNVSWRSYQRSRLKLYAAQSIGVSSASTATV